MAEPNSRYHLAAALIDAGYDEHSVDDALECFTDHEHHDGLTDILACVIEHKITPKAETARRAHLTAERNESAARYVLEQLLANDPRQTGPIGVPGATR